MNKYFMPAPYNFLEKELKEQLTRVKKLQAEWEPGLPTHEGDILNILMTLGTLYQKFSEYQEEP